MWLADKDYRNTSFSETLAVLFVSLFLTVP
jgi:hypothetical protein